MPAMAPMLQAACASHTPLMAFTNAISGVSVVASILIAGRKSDTLLIPILGAIAVASATINVVGGFVITDRMLRMFKRTPAKDSGKKEN